VEFLKKYIAPGWRVGWVMIHDRNHVLDEVRQGIKNLASVLQGGSNTLAQSTVPEALLRTKSDHYRHVVGELEINAKCIADKLGKIPGLKIIQPEGAMYTMIGLDIHHFKDISNDLEFAKQLLTEEAVYTLPGRIFKYENYIRMIICPPVAKLEEACNRIENFCKRHAK